MKMLLIVSIALLVGCGKASTTGSDNNKYSEKPELAVMKPNFSPRQRFSDSDAMAGGKIETKAASGEVVTSTITSPQSTERKIIYTASISLVVDDFDGMEQKISDTVKRHEGYLSQSELGRMQGKQRNGDWTARIPVDQYDNFIQAVSALGVPASLNQSASDVSEEFVDITARIDNKRKLESRILQLLERPDDKIEHVIEVERELARVREEIERMEGRLRYLSDQTAMTTVSIDVREERNYQPPQAITLGSRINTAWDNSLTQTGQVFENTVVFFVRNAIGLVAWVIGLTFAWIVFRFTRRKFLGTPAQEY